MKECKYEVDKYQSELRDCNKQICTLKDDVNVKSDRIASLNEQLKTMENTFSEYKYCSDMELQKLRDELRDSKVSFHCEKH